MNRTLLNADVLLLVFALANRQTQVALLSTCKFLYREGGKQLLKSAAVSIESEKGMRSFLRFMNADGGSRMRCLRCLKIDLKEPTESIAEQLETTINCLAPVSQLAILRIYSLEPLLSAHPSLCKALAELTSIKEIYFSRVETLSLEMLNSMRSKIEMVDISFDELEGGAVEDSIILLRRFSSSLRHLNVWGSTTIDPQDDGPRYPLLSELTLEEPAPPITWHYVRAFPNLKKLSIPSVDQTTYEAKAEGFPAVRARNVAQLRQHGCWASLDSFQGSILMLWLLGLSCPISALDLFDFGPVTSVILGEALGAARPSARLDIEFLNFSLFLDEAFTRAFAEGCGGTLRVLHLSLKIDYSEYEFEGDDLDLGDVLDAIREMLCSFTALESFALDIDFPINNAYREAHGHKLTPGEVLADDMDMDAICAAFNDAIPSAKHVHFAIQGHWKRGTVKVEIGSKDGNSK